MADSHEEKANESQDSRTIRIELPGSAFDRMFKMMSGFGGSETANSGCCEGQQGNCCQQPEDAKKQEFTFVIKRKG